MQPSFFSWCFSFLPSKKIKIVDIFRMRTRWSLILIDKGESAAAGFPLAQGFCDKYADFFARPILDAKSAITKP
jgi:hypothetical protein